MFKTVKKMYFLSYLKIFEIFILFMEEYVIKFVSYFEFTILKSKFKYHISLISLKNSILKNVLNKIRIVNLRNVLYN